MDLTSGYFQAPIAASSRKYTAFITDDGVYQWKRVPMGIKCAGSYFQQQMQLILRGLLDDCCFLYLDDIIIFGRTEAEYLTNVDKVFDRLREKKVVLSPTKCKFGMTEVEYVGHMINEKGLTFSKAKIDKVVDFPIPQVAKQLKSFLGLANYFRDHVQGYSEVTAPLQGMILDYQTTRKVKWDTGTEQVFAATQNVIKDI